MPDLVKGCWVAFDKDIRIDDVQEVVNAIRMLKSVAAVELSLADQTDWMNRTRITNELRKKIFEVLQ